MGGFNGGHRAGPDYFCAGLSHVEMWERALPALHPLRASQWSSWFKISAIAQTLLTKYRVRQLQRG